MNDFLNSGIIDVIGIIVIMVIVWTSIKYILRTMVVFTLIFIVVYGVYLSNPHKYDKLLAYIPKEKVVYVSKEYITKAAKETSKYINDETISKTMEKLKKWEEKTMKIDKVREKLLDEFLNWMKNHKIK